MTKTDKFSCSIERTTAAYRQAYERSRAGLGLKVEAIPAWRIWVWHHHGPEKKDCVFASITNPTPEQLAQAAIGSVLEWKDKPTALECVRVITTEFDRVQKAEGIQGTLAFGVRA